ncbi:type II toxin-antitoxin system VapC family toxin [Rhodopirellula europaea]|uniref:type II toxin-antitoxin system VapC family toxin n=1 Tax=Rhodopirellula europaea TaxID=1263866 RepID=UPI0030EC6BF8
MQYLVDTGVLLRLFVRNDPEHTNIRTLFRELTKRGHSLNTTAQNIAEFWNVSTRPASSCGGYGQDVASTERRVQFIEKMGNVLSDNPDAYLQWQQLVVRHRVQGVAVHDAKLVAVMLAVSISSIITLNGRAFARYTNVTALTPSQAIASLT